jgi:hypothetical protein
MSTDPLLVDRILGVVGLNHNLPERAVVLNADEQS